MPAERRQKLQALLDKSPGDTFLLYAMGMEYRKSGDAVKAIEFFDQVIQHDWGYCYAYHQKGQALESTGDMEGAKTAYLAGIDAATRKGDAHAKEEIAAALSNIE
jgi:tetratricopeptide (TPR) repeat protein